MSEKINVLYNRKPCYDILFTGSFDELWTELAALGCGDRRLCVVTDSRVDQLYGAEVLNILDGICRKAVIYVFRD